ncbi:MAG: DUF4974 domain-containing protein, partial [Bacteroidales bacterium]|nr:DUF4974 domain-containing protein [Bacteroidales bacterium]
KDEYTVTCLTGSVEVKSKSTKNNVVLKPNNRATVLKTGKIAKQDKVNTKESTAWLDKEFFYTASPLHHVFYEISLRYNVSIDIDPKVLKSKRTYTGQFQETKSVEEVLDIVTKPLGLKYIKEEKNKYRIIQNN